jgi:hypothetical protein
LGDLGQLHGLLGNHALALGYMDQRQQLPAGDPAEALSRRLARAHSLLHLGRAREASTEAEAALALANNTPALAHLRTLAQDRAALLAYASRNAERARVHYAELLLKQAIASSKPDGEPPGLAAANRMRWTLMCGAAAAVAGDHKAALDLLMAARAQLAGLDAGQLAAGKPPWASTPPLKTEDYSVLLAGLTAESARASKDPAGARAALAERLAGLEQRLAALPGEDALLLDLAETEYRLALVDRDAGETVHARDHLQAGLRHAATYAERTGTVAPDARLELLEAYAEGTLSGRLPRGTGSAAFLANLRKVYAFLCERPNPARAAERFRFGLYLTLFDLDHRTAPAPPVTPGAR